MEKFRQTKNKLIENNFFRPRWYSIFINPYFIDRYSLFGLVKRFASSTPDNAKVLDVGCGIKPYRDEFKTGDYTGIDIKGGGHSDDKKIVDVYYDGQNIPFEDSRFDTILCTQVLQHTTNPEKLIAECSRVLKVGGAIFLSMPFMYHEHEKPFDFQRFTSFKHQRVLTENEFTDIQIKKTTGFFGTFGQLFTLFLFEGIPFRASILKTLLSIFVFGPIQICSIVLDWLTRGSGATINYVVIAKKTPPQSDRAKGK